jgi:hypothetical protein
MRNAITSVHAEPELAGALFQVASRPPGRTRRKPGHIPLLAAGSQPERFGRLRFRRRWRSRGWSAAGRRGLDRPRRRSRRGPPSAARSAGRGVVVGTAGSPAVRRVRCGAKTKLSLCDRTYSCRNGCPRIDRDLNAAINLARLGGPNSTSWEMRTGTGSSPAASVKTGDGRGANHKTSPSTAMEGTARGDETSTPHTSKTGTATPQGEAA